MSNGNEKVKEREKINIHPRHQSEIRSVGFF